MEAMVRKASKKHREEQGENVLKPGDDIEVYIPNNDLESAFYFANLKGFRWASGCLRAIMRI